MILNSDAESCLVENTDNKRNNHEQKHNIKLKVGLCVFSVVLCLTLVIFIIILFLNILSYSFNITHVNDNTKTGNHEDYFFMLPVILPVQVANDTVSEVQSKGLFTKIAAPESLVFFILILSGCHDVFLKDKNSEDVDGNKNKSRSLMKAANAFKNQESIQTTDIISSKVSGKNVTAGIQIQESGLYYVYTCLQITCIKNKKNTKEVTHYVIVNTGSRNRTIIENKVNIPDGMGTYETSNALIAVRLTQRDIVSMTVSDDTYLYHSRKSNVLGVLKL